MIVRDKPGLWQLLFALRGSVLPRIAGPILGFAAFSALLVGLDRSGMLLMPRLEATPFTVFGIALSLFLGFRNNAAYDRWWEARRLWGGLVADLRALGRECAICVSGEGRRTAILRLARAFVHLHRLNLRRQTPDAAALAAGAGPFADAAHPPCAALDALAAEIAAGQAAGEIDGFGSRTLTTRLASIALQQAGCERIAATPLPFVYSLLVFRTCYLYCLLLPLALIGPAGWMAPVFTAIVAYVFFGLAEVTEELSHPFGATLNGLPLDALCRTIEVGLAPHLGEAPPARLEPVDYYLS
ncbi:MAG: bestrophin family ion channel [Paracoccaceae bacterium]